MKKTVLALSILFTVSASAAVLPNETELQQLQEDYNEQSSEVPGFIGTVIGGEKVNFQLEVNQSNQTIGAEFNGVQIDEIQRGEIDDPTLEVWTDIETVKEVAESEEVYQELREALDDGRIQYRTRKVTTKIKVTVLDTLNTLAGIAGI